MHELKFIDNSYDLKLASEYHISIQLGLDGFSFCILDVRRSKYVAFRHIPLIVGKLQFLAKKIETIFEQEDILNASFKTVSVSYSTTKSTLVPKTYSESEYVLRVAELTNDLGRTENINSEDLAGFNYQLVYCYPKELMTLLNRKFTDFRLMHKSVPLLSSVVSEQNENRNLLILNFEKKYIRIVAIKENQIVLYNSFYFKNEADFLYNTMNVWHLLQFDPARDEACIGGFVADDSSFIRQLKKYINNVNFLKPSADFDYGTLFDSVQKHQFVSLLNTYTCV